MKSGWTDISISFFAGNESEKPRNVRKMKIMSFLDHVHTSVIIAHLKSVLCGHVLIDRVRSLFTLPCRTNETLQESGPAIRLQYRKTDCWMWLMFKCVMKRNTCVASCSYPICVQMLVLHWTYSFIAVHLPTPCSLMYYKGINPSRVTPNISRDANKCLYNHGNHLFTEPIYPQTHGNSDTATAASFIIHWCCKLFVLKYYKVKLLSRCTL